MVMKSDDDIKHNVEKELQWDPEIDPRDIAVVLRSGVAISAAVSDRA
jgi:hypothetical protein